MAFGLSCPHAPSSARYMRSFKRRLDAAESRIGVVRTGLLRKSKEEADLSRKRYEELAKGNATYATASNLFTLSDAWDVLTDKFADMKGNVSGDVQTFNTNLTSAKQIVSGKNDNFHDLAAEVLGNRLRTPTSSSGTR